MQPMTRERLFLLHVKQLVATATRIMTLCHVCLAIPIHRAKRAEIRRRVSRNNQFGTFWPYGPRPHFIGPNTHEIRCRVERNSPFGTFWPYGIAATLHRAKTARISQNCLSKQPIWHFLALWPSSPLHRAKHTWKFDAVSNETVRLARFGPMALQPRFIGPKRQEIRRNACRNTQCGTFWPYGLSQKKTST